MSENKDGFDEEFEVITMTDEETGEDIEFSVIDSLEEKGETYLLVVETALMDDGETDAIILKRTSSEGEDDIFSLVEEDEEFEKIAELFQKNGDDYDVEIEE
ncbi:MAG: DUF1292 domain-containing protein [Clostridiales bacterium]|nr:DUF1292 domain-containing protein [Clostridiales bacterium]